LIPSPGESAPSAVSDTKALPFSILPCRLLF